MSPAKFSSAKLALFAPTSFLNQSRSCARLGWTFDAFDSTVSIENNRTDSAVVRFHVESISQIASGRLKPLLKPAP